MPDTGILGLASLARFARPGPPGGCRQWLSFSDRKAMTIWGVSSAAHCIGAPKTLKGELVTAVALSPRRLVLFSYVGLDRVTGGRGKELPLPHKIWDGTWN